MLFACIFYSNFASDESILFVCTFIVNCFSVCYDILSAFNESDFWDCMTKISSKHIEVRSCFDVFVEGN